MHWSGITSAAWTLPVTHQSPNAFAYRPPALRHVATLLVHLKTNSLAESYVILIGTHSFHPQHTLTHSHSMHSNSLLAGAWIPYSLCHTESLPKIAKTNESSSHSSQSRHTVYRVRHQIKKLHSACENKMMTILTITIHPNNPMPVRVKYWFIRKPSADSHIADSAKT